jgi:hypothetical protein
LKPAIDAGRKGEVYRLCALMVALCTVQGYFCMSDKSSEQFIVTGWPLAVAVTTTCAGPPLYNWQRSLHITIMWHANLLLATLPCADLSVCPAQAAGRVRP